MRIIKFSLIFISLFIYLLIGIVIRIVLVFAKPQTYTRTLNRMTYYLMHVFVRIGNLRVTVKGNKSILKDKGLFIISPHVGYLDAVILGTLLPGSFTTKTEVKKIPLLGQVVTIGDSIFIDRNKKNNISDYIDVMTDRLNNKINIFNFPEGHATNGKEILPFFPSFFNAPLRAKSPIVPMTIDYKKVNGETDFNRDEVYCYDGKVSTIRHLWNLMNLKRVDITVTVHEVIAPNGRAVNSKSRNDISNICMDRLSSYKNLPIAEEHPFQRPVSENSKK